MLCISIIKADNFRMMVYGTNYNYWLLLIFNILDVVNNELVEL